MKIRTQTEIVFEVPEEYEQALNFNEVNKMNGWDAHFYASSIAFINKKECEVPTKEEKNNGSAERNGNNSKGAEEDS
jgi:hypothetical protein